MFCSSSGSPRSTRSGHPCSAGGSGRDSGLGSDDSPPAIKGSGCGAEMVEVRLVNLLSGQEVLRIVLHGELPLSHVKKMLYEAGGPDPEFQALVSPESAEPPPELCKISQMAGPGATSLELQVVFRSIRVLRVRVWTGSLVDKVEFVLSDGRSNVSGGSGGSEREPFELSEEEFIQKVEARHGDSLDAIRFCTNRGRLSQWYGNERGGRDPISFAADAGHQFWGVERGRGWAHCGCVQQLLQRRVPVAAAGAGCT